MQLNILWWETQSLLTFTCSQKYKWLHDVPGRPVISNCGYYTESISSFLDFHKPLAWEVKSYMKDTNDFLKKLHSLPNLPDDIKKRKRKKETL